jgi:hypothetical protein
MLGNEVLVKMWVGAASGFTSECYTAILRAGDQHLLAQARAVDPHQLPDAVTTTIAAPTARALRHPTK